MLLRMKRLLLLCLISLCGESLFAIHEEYREGYELTSSQVSSAQQERPMSFYKDGKVVFFVGDTAYSAVIGNSNDLEKVEVCQELCGLGIWGTFAYDPRRRTIYFARIDELGNSDLYEAQLQGNTFSQPKLMNIEGLEKLRKDVRGSSTVMGQWTYRYNRVSGFYNPTIAEGGNKIYFTGDFPKKSYGGKDIWYIERDKSDKSNYEWKMPVNASDSVERLNGPSREDYAFIVGDTTMYLTSDRPGGFGGLDLYVSHYRPMEFSVWDTTLNDSVKVTRKVWTKPVTMDSTYNSSANDYNFIGNKKLVMLMSNRAGGKGRDDIYVPQPFHAEPDFDLTPMAALTEPKGFHWVLFFFNFNESVMLPEYLVQLDELVSAMKEFPGVKFEVSGHTDSRGSYEYNLKLSDKRAKYVRSLLIERGMNPEDMVAVGRSYSDPVIPNAQTEPEHEQNRRVDIKILDE